MYYNIHLLKKKGTDKSAPFNLNVYLLSFEIKIEKQMSAFSYL